MSQSEDQVKEEKKNVKVKNAVVIYHANCNDGFGAAWAFWRLVDEKGEYEEVEYIACNYGDEPIIHSGVDLFILDFSFPRDHLKAFCELTNKVLLLDHHKTAEEALTNWPDQPANLEIVFDKNRSGASLTWDYFSAKYTPDWIGQRPKLIGFIEDRDLWKFQYEGTKAIHEVLSLLPKDFDKWNRFAHRIEGPTGYLEAVREGELIREHTLSICKSILESGTRPCTINGAEGLVVNAPGMFASELGNMLAVQSSTFGASYYHEANGSVKFSLRSNGDYDVSAIAKVFGGGGHRNAAGFTLRGSMRDNEKDNGVTIWTGEKDDNVLSLLP